MISSATEQQIPYTLRIESFEPGILRLGVRVDNVEVAAAASFDVFNEDFTERSRFTHTTEILTAPRYFDPGSTVFVECQRYGMPVDRHTRRITIAEGENTVFFDSPDWGIDNHEPNQLPGMSGVELDVPGVIEATISDDSDRRDWYRLVNIPDERLSLHLTTIPPGGGVDIDMSSLVGDDFGGGDLSDGQNDVPLAVWQRNCKPPCE